MQKQAPATRPAARPSGERPAGPATAAPAGAGLIFAAVLTLALLAAYWNSFRVPFLLDDEGSITDNPTLHSFATALFPPNERGDTVSGRPLLNLSLAVNWRLGGTDVFGYHVGNLLIHGLAALSLFGVIRRTLLLPGLMEHTGRHASLLAAGAALLWALHPLQTESVTYIVQRAESLVGLLFLATFYAFIRATTTPSRVWAVVAGVLCVLGMAAKEVMAAAPLLLFLYDRAFISGTFGEAWRRHRGMHLAFASGWLLLLALVISTGLRGSTVGYARVTWLDYALTQAPGITTYLMRAIVPVHLVFDYGAILEKRPLVVLGGLAVVGLLVAATIVLLRRRPGLGFIGAWFFLILAPSSSVVPVASQTLAEHRMYLPLAAVMLAVVLLAWRHLGRAAWGVLGAVAVAFSIGTFDRNRDYRSPLAIWEDTAVKVPDNPRALNNLGIHLRDAGRTEEAIVQMYRAVELVPGYALGRSNLGTTLVRHALGVPQSGDDIEVGSRRKARAERVARDPELARLVEAGLEHLRLAVEIDADNARYWSNYATALFECGRAAEAVPAYERAITLEPDNSVHHFNLANVLAEQGRLEDAAAHYEQALHMVAYQADVLTNYGILLRWMERWPESIARLSAARELAPETARVRSNLGVSLLASGRAEAGIAELTRALELDPRLPQARYHLGYALGQRGRVGEAIVHFEALLETEPPTAELLCNLGVLHAREGNIERAVALTRQAVELDPTYEPARDNLGLLQRLLGESAGGARP